MLRTFTGRLSKMAALAASVAVLATAPRPAVADNLADALIGAYNSSGLLEQNRALLRAADEDVAIALSALRPIVNWTARIQSDYTKSGNGLTSTSSSPDTFFTGLELNQLIYDGGAARLGKQAAQETVLSTRQSLVQVEQQILLRAVTAYLSVLLQEEAVGIRQNNVRLLGEELRASEDRFEVGEVTRTDVALSQSRLANARANLADANGALTTAHAEYINAVGRHPGRTAGQPSMPGLPRSEEDAVALALRNHPALLSAQHQVRALELGIEQQRANLGPNVRFQADLGLTDDFGGSNFNESATARMIYSQPLYAGGRLAATVRRIMAQRDASRANLLNVQRDVTQDVSDAYVRYQTADASLTASDERVRAAQVAFDGIREEATLGARTTLDVLTAEQDLLDAQLARVSARTERSLAAYQLLASQGLLTAERLGLAVQIYDPTLYYNMVKDAPAAISKRSRDLDRVLEALGKK
ncbi:TolC family outer membrane protein [Ruegeria pomeroyi]|uniref:TolC family outer membrane protein n=1 Tax=Ruegeria alba TaxID=2916756 RepID=A0ABS9NVR7_9RHOB|nr:TolC family outer membrane protein [Ruegeria alba]MCE8513573.1 TolC family outer membrane protein [Ruegeria pomeroyi]MCE8521264.1 TolC family outer membrane protein [Ruegeria pomeroyi]MCE8525802.1 TolC family outer membrane protein [Ruegeria pomeroyi]MCE8529170.1 TolC family outer membrane protein [Ruegeria pomeroyi]MCE8533355.1 TolC family outer membrane protein [Ruegeria pomeroyi]